jgi:AcrR family transcriptional regulator
MTAPDTAGTPKPAHNTGRQALLDAVTDVVAERGLRGATYRAVAEKAGVSYGLVSHHFGSRETMIREALGQTVESVAREALAGREGLDGLGKKLPAYIQAAENRLAFQYELTMEARRQEGLAPHIEAMYTDVHELLLEDLRTLDVEGVGDDLAWFVLAVIDGVILQQIVFSDPVRSEASLRTLRGLLAHHTRD